MKGSRPCGPEPRGSFSRTGLPLGSRRRSGKKHARAPVPKSRNYVRDFTRDFPRISHSLQSDPFPVEHTESERDQFDNFTSEFLLSFIYSPCIFCKIVEFFSQRGSHFQFQCSLSQIGVSPSPQLPGTGDLTSSTKACPIYLKNVCGIFLLSLHSHIAALVKLDYLSPNHFKFLTGVLVSCLSPLPKQN